jgi:hypothetical protein
MSGEGNALICDCRYSIKSMKAPDGTLFEPVEPVCQHENFPWVEFPRGSGFHDPLYCRVALQSGQCPLGKVLLNA